VGSVGEYAAFVHNTTPHSATSFFLKYYLKWAIRIQSILLANRLAMSQTCGRASVMRSPPARRSRSPYYRSAGHRRFCLRTTLSRGMGWSRGFEWVSSFIQCLTLLAWMTSCTVRISRSSWIIALVTHHGASTVARTTGISVSLQCWTWKHSHIIQCHRSI